MSRQNKRIFEFGPFSIDTVNRQLLRNGEVVPLKAKAVDTLLLLIESNGDVVEKDDLMQALWPDSFVEEANLTQNIYTLRKALGPDYIETIPRRGYRFSAQVKEGGNGAANVIVIQERTRTSVSYEEEIEAPLKAEGFIDVTPSARQLPAVTSRSQGRAWWIAGACLGGVVVALTIFFWPRHRPLPFESAKLTKFTTTGNAVKVAISPDGKSVAYVLNESGQQSVWLRQMATGKELPIVPAETTDIYGLTFTPDGSYLFYVSQPQNQLAVLYQVTSFGGAPNKLVEDVDSPVTFSPDGKQMAFLRFSPGAAALMIASIDGTGERALVTTHATDDVRLGPNGILPPSWSHDGKLIACPVSINSTQGKQAIYAFRTSDGVGSRMTMTNWPALGRVEWSPDGSGIFVTVIESESSADQQIWFVPYPSGAARRLTNDLTDYPEISVTADGGTLAVIQSEKKANIWVAPADNLDHPRQLTATSYDGLNGLSWAPDGRIVYTSWISGEQNLWITDVNGGARTQLTSHAGFHETPVVSPDGKYIVFLCNRNGEENLWRIDIDGKHRIQLTHGEGDRQPTFTADGQFIIFRSGSPAHLFRMGINGGTPVQLTDTRFFDPNVSPDGKLIACGYRPTPTDRNRVAILPVDGGQPRLICEFPALYSRIHWKPDGSGITYAARQSGVGNIWEQSLDGSSPKQLTHWGPAPVFSFDWSRDGKWLAYANGTLTSDVVLITDTHR